MSTTEQQAPKFPFLTSFAFPALFVFLVPVLSLVFFLHAQARFDSRIRESIIEEIRADKKLTKEERERAIAFFNEVSFSQLASREETAKLLSDDTRLYYSTFRWAIVLSAGAIITGAAVLLLVGAGVALSFRSQFVQYWCLAVSWHVLRVSSALQVVAQGALLVALSFWVTALWFNFYSVKLILVVGVLAVVGVGAVLAGIFKRVNSDHVVPGRVLTKDEAAPVWNELQRICDRVGTHPPDQIIAGIDDNFFVTEREVIVGGKVYRGRTLFVSLSLLKQLHGSEADAILAHEMAHFSGQDTLYSGKIAPLLSRYDHYLQALHGGAVTLPVFYFMRCFRVLYELSLSRQSRQREFRADRISVETTSARAVAGALLRTAAYSRYRAGVENDLFMQERAMEAANVSERIEHGFHQYAARFTSGPDIGRLAPAHPFDTHPPLSQRLQAIGMPLEHEETRALLTASGDGGWYRHLPAAEGMEKEQWREYEERFRHHHEQSLPYRFLPESAEEHEIVVKSFPPISIPSGQGVLTLDCEKMGFEKWPGPIPYADIVALSVDDNRVLTITRRLGSPSQSIKLSKFADQQGVIDAINRYYGRYQSAVGYQALKKTLARVTDLPAE